MSSRLLERITGSNAARHLLRRFFDEGRMKKALDVLAGERRATSLSCYMASGALRILTMIGSTAFGVSDSLIRENLSNSIFRRAFSSVVKGLTSFGMTRPFVPGAPFQIVWNVTRACNLKCQHCYENAGKREPDELTTEEAIACIDKLVNAGVVLLAFSGGEPTLREDILELIRRSSMKGMYVAIATNGLTFSNRKRVQEFKRAGLSFVQISLDGCNPETHDAFRGVPGAFARTLQGIRNCVDEGLFVEVAMTATKNNIAQVEDTIDIASNIGAQWFMLYNFVPTGRGKEIIECDLSPD
ncbi:MAG: radical SAM protein, partial [Candidatus Thorarchaeota archaeon]